MALMTTKPLYNAWNKTAGRWAFTRECATTNTDLVRQRISRLRMTSPGVARDDYEIREENRYWLQRSRATARQPEAV